VFQILRGDFQYALENLSVITEDTGEEFVERLGQHLFSYYFWQIYPLTGDESLLQRFYEKTNHDPKCWAQLFDNVGRSLRNSGKHLDKELIPRAIAFFDWRFEEAQAQELQAFTFWLDAECLDPEWRLRSYAKILELGRGKNIGLSFEVSVLHKLLPDHVPSVVECFAKITDALDQTTQMYIAAEYGRPILRAGLNAQDARVRENAERARENLLKLARFDFLDLQ